MQVTRVCAEDLSDSVQAAADAVRGLEDSVAVLRDAVLEEDDRDVEGQRCIDEAARLWGAARGIADRLALWPAFGGVER